MQGDQPRIVPRLRVTGEARTGVRLFLAGSTRQQASSCGKDPLVCLWQDWRHNLARVHTFVNANHARDNLLFRIALKARASAGPVEQQPSLVSQHPFSPSSDLSGDSSPKNPLMSPATAKLSHSEGPGLPERLKNKLQTIKTHLQHSKKFEIPSFQKIPAAEKWPPIDRDSAAALALEHELQELSRDEAARSISESKEASLKLQIALSFCQEPLAQKVVSILCEKLTFYMKHPFGSYVVQRASNRDLQFMDLVSNRCIEHFEEFIQDEFASRIIQKIVETKQSFRDSVVRLFSLNLSKYLEFGPAVFILITLIECSQGSKATNFIMDYIVNEPKLLNNKNFKKIVASYLEHCSEAELPRLVNLLHLNKKLLPCLNDKFKVILILLLVQRGCEEFTEKICRMLVQKTSLVFESKYFKFLLIKLIERNKLDFCRKVHTAITSLKSSQLWFVHRMEPDAVEFFKYALLATCSEDHTKALKILREIEEFKYKAKATQAQQTQSIKNRPTADGLSSISLNR